jgi:MerR family transcriptional regulator, light-induced transcriptional regulator
MRRPIITDQPSSGSFSIGELAARTGVPVGTLRTWEARYGVPSPVRGTGGHRRYGSDDVDLVLQTLRHRAGGLSMSVAAERARSHVAAGEASVFAGLRRRHPELTVQVLRKPTLLALCRAIEDECCAQADEPLLFASFQRQRFFRASERRWRDLTRTARAAYVLADFPAVASKGSGSLAARAPAEGPVRVPVPVDASVNREWALVCDAQDYPGCVVGWERPGQLDRPDRLREFETLWSVDPVVVRDAARVCAGLVEQYRAGEGFPLWQALEDTPPPASLETRRASRVFDRLLAYLSASVADVPRSGS